MCPLEPRLAPLEEGEWSGEQRELLAPLARDGHVANIFRTLARHPKLLKRWLPFANHLLFKSSLAPREREMLILRIAWHTGAEYEWGHHAVIGRGAGLSDAEIERVAAGPAAPGWTAFEAVLLRAVDELHGRSCLGDENLGGAGRALRHRPDPGSGLHRRQLCRARHGAQQPRRAP